MASIELNHPFHQAILGRLISVNGCTHQNPSGLKSQANPYSQGDYLSSSLTATLSQFLALGVVQPQTGLDALRLAYFKKLEFRGNTHWHWLGVGHPLPIEKIIHPYVIGGGVSCLLLLHDRWAGSNGLFGSCGR
jgi:hypothetical protein